MDDAHTAFLPFQVSSYTLGSCSLGCMSSELPQVWETTETEQLGWPALKFALCVGFEVFQSLQLQTEWARFAFGIVHVLESVASSLLMCLNPQFVSVLPGVDTVSLAVLVKKCFLTPLDSSSQTGQPGSQLDLSDLPAALKRASLPWCLSI